MKLKQLLIPADRLSITEHIQIFCDIYNYPMEIYIGQDMNLVYQNEVYNILLAGTPFSIDSILMAALIEFRHNDNIPEPNGNLVVIDGYNCFIKKGEFWFPYIFRFVSSSSKNTKLSRGEFNTDNEHPMRWKTLVRFLKTFYPYRKRFSLYRTFSPMANFYTYLKSLYVEFKSIPTIELEHFAENRRQRLRIRDELYRRKVLSNMA